MTILETLVSAVQSLIAQKLRSFLTLLGIVIGISTLIAIVTLIEGANTYISDKVVDLNPDVFQVSQFPRLFINFNEYIKAQKWKRIEYNDYEALAEQSRECLRIGVAATAQDLIKHRGQSSKNTTVRGVSPNMIDIERYEVEDGRYFDTPDNQGRRPVCILGADLVEALFRGEDPVGKEITIGGRGFRVVGTIKRLGSIFGASRDKFVLVPIQTLFKIYGSHRSVAIYGQARRKDQLESAISEVRGILRERRHVPFGGEDTFSISTADTIISIYKTVTSSFFLVTIIIASISLVVGGVVIMNIMMVSVKERTREIGIRRAIGARQRDILRQFLVEAVTLCTLGGAAGVMVGVFLAKTIEALTPFPADVRPVVVMLGLVVASMIGLFFGIYPAVRAAKLNPIDSLRYE